MNQEEISLRQKVINFITFWHNDYIIDYWWRKKYNIPFGSNKHRSMSFIDMYIEYQEEIEINKIREKENSVEDDENVHITKEEIDGDYENINLEDF